MAKRGRKPKEGAERKGYFYEPEETAFINFIKAEDEIEKNKIFNSILLPAFTKMIESIIRRYKLYLPDEMFQETFDDTMSFMISKINCFNINSGYKAYSYCGTICKNYLILKINMFNKNQKRTESYEDNSNIFENKIELSSDPQTSNLAFLNELMTDTITEINAIIADKVKLKLTNNEIKVGLALVSLMENWEELFAQMGSNKFNKSSILLYLKDLTNLNTTDIRDSMKKYKVAYYAIKKGLIEE